MMGQNREKISFPEISRDDMHKMPVSLRKLRESFSYVKSNKLTTATKEISLLEFLRTVKVANCFYLLLCIHAILS